LRFEEIGMEWKAAAGNAFLLVIQTDATRVYRYWIEGAA
jgi:hypothetical protein